MKKYFYFLAIFLTLLSRYAVADTSPLKIGVLVCLTGECAEWGDNSLKGIKLAQDEINSSGGVLSRQIELVIEDTAEGGGGAKAVTAYTKLTRDSRISYLIGPSWTTGGLSVAPLAAKAKGIVITSPSIGVADFNEAADHIFNTWPHDDFASKALAKYSIDKGWRKAAIFSSQQPWESTQGDTFESEFIRLGGTISSKQEPLPSLSDLRTETLKIIQSTPDVVFLSNFNQMGIAAKQLRNSGFKGQLLAILMDDSRIQAAAGALNGTVFAGYPDPSDAFKHAFRDKYHQKPGITADTAYDILKMYAEAVKKANSTNVETMLPAFRNIDYSGASGQLKFDEKGAVKRTPVFFVVKDKEIERIENR